MTRIATSVFTFPLKAILLASACALGLIGLVYPAGAQDAIAGEIDFAHQVVPILTQHCAECHAGFRAEGGFSINTRELILEADMATPGDAADSYLLELVKSKDPDNQMPPKGNPRVTDEQIAVLEQWINQGLKWEPGFTLADDTYEPPLKLRKVELPAATEGRENPIDRLIDHYLTSRGKSLPPVVDDHTFYRRVSLDLLGLLPKKEDLEAFVADSDPKKREKLVDRLLAEDHEYAVHWMAFWNDLLRNEYVGAGYIDGGRKLISNWLYKSLEENKPYDDFVRELISPNPDSEGFIYGIKWRGLVNASQVREIQFAQNVSQVFLGINLKCASCHDSFIDRWTLEETYALASIYSERELEIHRCDKPTGRMAKAGWLFPELGQVEATLPQPERLKQLSELLVAEENGRFSRTIANRLWRQMMGRGVVHPVDAMQTRPWNEDLLDYLAGHLIEQDYDVKQFLRTIVTSQAYQAESVIEHQEPPAEKYEYQGPIARRMSAEQFIDAVWTLTDRFPRKPHPGAAAFLEQNPDSKGHPVRATLVTSDLLQRSLGRPNREQVVTSRPTLLTMLQALDLSNNPNLTQLLSREASAMLGRMDRMTVEEQVAELYQRALSRRPTEDEMPILLELVGTEPTQAGFEDLLWSIVMLPEFQTVR